MSFESNRLGRAAKALLLGGVAVMALSVPTSAAEYKLSVNKERLINADREPQNWLMQQGNYSNWRYSALTQINRDNVRSLRMVWALALGGLKDSGQNGTQAELNPLVDGGIMYTADGWGTVYKIDARKGTQGDFLWTSDPGVPHEGNAPLSRGIALWGDTVISPLVDGRIVALNRDTGEIIWDKQVGKKNEFGSPETFKVSPMMAEDLAVVGNSNGDGGTRGYVVAVDAATGAEKWRWWAVPAPGEPGSETWKDKTNAWKTGGGSIWQTGSYDPETKTTYWGTGNPVPLYDPQARPGDNLFTNSAVAFDIATGKMKWYFQYLPNDGWDYDEIGVHMLIDLPVNGQSRKTVFHFGRNGFTYLLDRNNGNFIQATQYVNELNWTKGLDPKTGKPVEYDPKLDVQKYIPESRPMRGDAMKRSCPTWHGGVAHQPPAYNPIKKIAYGVGAEGCYSGDTGQQAYRSDQGGLDNAKSGKRTYTSDLYYGSITAVDVPNNKQIAKAITDIENRSAATATAAGLVWTATQDGNLLAYNDDTLEELYRFNVGTPLKGGVVTYAVGPKQYVAVQSGGRHLHPVKFDNLELSSYLYVFALPDDLTASRPAR